MNDSLFTGLMTGLPAIIIVVVCLGLVCLGLRRWRKSDNQAYSCGCREQDCPFPRHTYKWIDQ